MRKENKEAKKHVLTEKDFLTSKDPKIVTLVRMLSTKLYSFNVKKALYAAGTISGKGLLFNDNIFNLPIGTKNSKGDILISNDVLSILDRYLLVEEIANQGDALTAFMVEHDDSFYAVIKANKDSDVKVNQQEYTQIFSRCYGSMSDTILEHKVNILLQEDEKLMDIMNNELKAIENGAN